MTSPLRPLDADERYRCASCGNVTRFDVVRLARTRRFHHFDLAGSDHVEEEDVLDEQIESVVCHWCGTGDGVTIEAQPNAGP